MTCGLFLFLFFICVNGQTALYVSTLGDDYTGNGTEINPFQSLTRTLIELVLYSGNYE